MRYFQQEVFSLEHFSHGPELVMYWSHAAVNSHKEDEEHLELEVRWHCPSNQLISMSASWSTQLVSWSGLPMDSVHKCSSLVGQWKVEVWVQGQRQGWCTFHVHAGKEGLPPPWGTYFTTAAEEKNRTQDTKRRLGWGIQIWEKLVKGDPIKKLQSNSPTACIINQRAVSLSGSPTLHHGAYAGHAVCLVPVVFGILMAVGGRRDRFAKRKMEAEERNGQS
eukprot:symbB.v1.2.008672.t1/scaffold539.1/size189864/4